jgi:hypothetical protein
MKKVLGGGLLGIYLPIGAGVQAAFSAGFRKGPGECVVVFRKWIGGDKT